MLRGCEDRHLDNVTKCSSTRIHDYSTTYDVTLHCCDGNVCNRVGMVAPSSFLVSLLVTVLMFWWIC